MHKIVIIFMVLKVGGKGAAGFRIIRNAQECHHFNVFGSGWEGGEWLQNHTKSIGLSTLEVGGRGTAGRNIVRNA